jgi:outer membrane protein OmpA-like peptidoglycan-associated protein
MKKKISTAGTAVACAMVAALSLTEAQAAERGEAGIGGYNRMALGVDLVGQLPVADYADEVGLGLGGLLRFKYHPLENSSVLGLTLRSGYIWHLGKKIEYNTFTETTNHSMLPILGGVRLTLPGSPLYVAAEGGGVLHFHRTAEDPGSASTQTRWTPGWTAGIGYEVGRTDVRLGLHFPDATDMGGTTAIGFSVGYSFWGKSRPAAPARPHVVEVERYVPAAPQTELQKQLLTTGMLLLDAAYFETGKTQISINSKPYLDLIARLLTAYPKLQIEVGGHTDNVGGLDYNRHLSQGRAQAVVDHMLEAEPALRGRLVAKGYAYSQPKATNSTAEGRQLNRRTELKVLNREALREYQ